MTAQEVLGTLEGLGKPQTAAMYKRHGSGKNVFGVLTSDIAKFQKKIKVDNALAIDLCHERADCTLLPMRNVYQSLPHHRLQTNTGAPRAYHDGTRVQRFPARFPGIHRAR